MAGDFAVTISETRYALKRRLSRAWFSEVRKLVYPAYISPEAWPGKQFYDAAYYQMSDSMKLSLGPFGPERLDELNRKAFLSYITPRYRMPFFFTPYGQSCWPLHLSPYLYGYW